MIQEIKDIKKYSFSPILESREELYSTEISLFGKTFRIMDDYWMKHIHVKITDKCDAHCPFCIEKGSSIKEDKDILFANLSRLLEQMSLQGHLTTVSITGGEPSLCQYTGEVVDLIKSYDTFLNINTNFHQTISSVSDADWINISRHTLGNDGYTGIRALDTKNLLEYKRQHPRSKARLQCVLHEKGLKDVGDILAFIENYQNMVDDFSFRRLINTTESRNDNDLFQKFKHYLYNNASFVEQVLKDYYVYETWNLNGNMITLSHSNMALLKKLEQQEDDSVLREIIVHPDGLVSGSWYRDKKIIKQ